jgi:hypothetical protein
MSAIIAGTYSVAATNCMINAALISDTDATRQVLHACLCRPDILTGRLTAA